MARPSDEDLDGLLTKVKAWAKKQRAQLSAEKQFLESVKDGQALSSSVKNSNAIDELASLEVSIQKLNI